MYKNLPEYKTKIRSLSPLLAYLVLLATIFQISMLCCIDYDVKLHCLQNQDQDKKKKRVDINYVKNDTLDALYGRTTSSAETQIQIGSSQPTHDPLKKLI